MAEGAGDWRISCRGSCLRQYLAYIAFTQGSIALYVRGEMEGGGP